MKRKLSSVLALIICIILITGCSIKQANNSNLGEQTNNKQKIIVVVVDQKNKTPIKDAKVYILGDSSVYTTDELGKTQEIEVELNRDYFEKYIDEVKNKMRSGFINVVVVKDGYARHIETDYSIYPGDAVAIAKIELSKGSKTTKRCNEPDVTYINNLVKSYEKFDGEGIKTNNMKKYKVILKDNNNKPLGDVKVVIPEANMAVKSDDKGTCEFEVPYDCSYRINYPVKKDYGEITILAYKEGYEYNVVLKAHVNQNEKNNSTTIKLKKVSGYKVNYEMVEASDKWLEAIISSYKQ